MAHFLFWLPPSLGGELEPLYNWKSALHRAVAVVVAAEAVDVAVVVVAEADESPPGCREPSTRCSSICSWADD